MITPLLSNGSGGLDKPAPVLHAVVHIPPRHPPSCHHRSARASTHGFPVLAGRQLLVDEEREQAGGDDEDDAEDHHGAGVLPGPCRRLAADQRVPCGELDGGHFGLAGAGPSQRRPERGNRGSAGYPACNRATMGAHVRRLGR